VASDNPEQGYEAADQAGGSIESGVYLAKDEEGKDVKIKFQISATASQHPQFVISELRY